MLNRCESGPHLRRHFLRVWQHSDHDIDRQRRVQGRIHPIVAASPSSGSCPASTAALSRTKSPFASCFASATFRSCKKPTSTTALARSSGAFFGMSAITSARSAFAWSRHRSSALKQVLELFFRFLQWFLGKVFGVCCQRILAGCCQREQVLWFLAIAIEVAVITKGPQQCQRLLAIAGGDQTFCLVNALASCQ